MLDLPPKPVFGAECPETRGLGWQVWQIQEGFSDRFGFRLGVWHGAVDPQRHLPHLPPFDERRMLK